MSNEQSITHIKLSSQRLKLLNELLRKQDVALRQNTILPHDRPLPEKIPLSFAQQSLWFLDQLEPEKSTYNMPAAFRMSGPLHRILLERSFNELIRRHEILRTTFPSINGESVQAIHPFHTLVIPSTDLRAHTEDEQRERVKQIILEVTAPFHLADGPLLRIRLVQLQEEEHILLIALHHIIADGWSINILVHELSTLYTAFLKDEAPLLPEPQLQYADYALWQRAWLQGERLETQRRYWREHLGENKSILHLPTDYPRPDVQTYRGKHLSFVLSPALTTRIMRLAQKEEVTLFMVLLAAFQVLLFRYTGQQDIVVGTPIANRDRDELKGVVGFFTNTLALRTIVPEQGTFRDLLALVRQTTLDGYAHQDLPFEQVVATLHPNRDLSYSPIFQVMFSLLYDDMVSGLRLPGLNVEALEIEQTTAKFDLSLDIVVKEEEVHGAFEYNTELFAEETITRLSETLRTILEAVAVDPIQRITRLPLLTEPDRLRVIETWNTIARKFPSPGGIHRIIEEQVEKTPDAIAAVFGQDALTFRVLNQRANQLARHLRVLRVSPETRVGIFLTYSLEMLVSILAVIKAGGAYVPLELSYPEERLIAILQDAQASVVLTEQQLLEKLPACSVQLCVVDAEWHHISSYSAENVESGVQPENLVYLLYTSGSTGSPKGVMIRHQGLINAWYAWENAYTLSSHCYAHLQMANCSFDVFAGDLVRALCSGGKLVLCPKEILLAPAELYSLMQREHTDCAEFVPVVMRMLLTYLERTGQRLEFMQRLIVGSDSWSMQEYQRLRVLCDPRIQPINSYGASEATIDSTYYPGEVSPAQAPETSLVPIGVPFANTRIYVLDARLELVPIGAPGEIYIGGPGLARGYSNSPERTAECFVPDPFSKIPGARIYKTGDLARYHTNGTLEFLGRADHQIKLRGFRIEPGEIEAALQSLPIVQEAVVLAQEKTSGEKYLVAYVVPKAEGSQQEKALRQALQGKLPHYMLPAVFILLSEMPLNAAGKLDRLALPHPEKSILVDPNTSVAPRNAIEETIAAIWSGLLGVEQIGIYENFFERGGHSLLAAQTAARLRDVFQIDLPLRLLFEAPTVASLAEHVVVAQHEQSGLEMMPPLLPVSREHPLLASFAQQRLWFLDQLEPQSSGYNMATAYRITGDLNVDALTQSFIEIVRRHEILRTVFQDRDGRPWQVIRSLEQFSPHLITVDLRHLSGSERDEQLHQLMANEAAHPFNLTLGPLVRIKLLCIDINEYVVLFTMHHIISDGWSINVLMQELSLHYAAQTEGKSANLPPLSIQYADYAAWQHQWLQGQALNDHVRYWKEQLAHSPDWIESLTGRSRSARAHMPGKQSTFLIEEPLAKQLLTFSQREGVTLFMLLLAAWLTLLYRYTRQDDLVIGTPVAGRSLPELEGLIGLFVNTLALRVDMSGNPGFKDLLERVRKTTLEAYTHQDIPFDRVVAETRSERNQPSNPLFQIVFALQNKQTVNLVLPGVQFTQLQIHSGTVPFDLVLDLVEDLDGLHGTLAYSTDLFSTTFIEQMAVHYRGLLSNILAHPEQTLEALPLSTEESVQPQTASKADHLPQPDQFVTISELFAEQVQRTPEALAVCIGTTHLSYQRLHEETNQLANYLRRLGVGPEVRVGICCNSSIELIISMLGVLKAGGAYVPIDPATPSERLKLMLTLAQCKLILTQQQLGEELLPRETRRLYLDRSRRRITAEPIELPPAVTHPESLAYIIFTSGSTGQPKGVLVPHRGLTNLARAQIQAFAIKPMSRVLQFASISFDASVSEVLMALLSGATLYLCEPEIARAGTDLLAILQRQAITAITLPPSVLTTLPHADLPALQTVIVAGEAATGELLGKWQASGRRIYNAYGPTEATVCTTLTVVEPADSIPPLGPALPQVQCFILDQQLYPVLPGVAGQIYVGGVSITRGYLDAPDLTAEHFLPDPLSSIPGARLYSTGDIARYLPQGKSVFLKRADEQVKFRGYRIEPGEIEYVLSEHFSIRQAVVMLREDTPGLQRLVAYLVTQEVSLDEHSILAYLREKLPEYMIPTILVKLDAFPLTLSGKIDRRALPEPEKKVGTLASDSTQAPRSQLEIQLAQIWCEVLEIESVSLDQSFFELGGHSLSATQVVSRLQEVFQIEVSLHTFMQRSRVADWVEILKESGWQAPEHAPAQRIISVPRDEELPLSYAQQRLWIVHQLEPDDVSYNVFAAFRMQGPLDISALQRSLTEITRRHEVLRTIFQMGKSGPVQRILSPSLLPLPLIDISHMASDQREAELTQLAEQEAHTPFDLLSGPLLRGKLVRLAKDQHVALFTMHHIVTDGWSIGLLAGELSLLYAAYTQGLVSPLPDHALQYADYAAWQHARKEHGGFTKDLHFWQQQLAGIPLQLALPTDYSRPAKPDWQGTMYETRLDEELTASLKHLCQQEEITLFMTLLAAWSILLHMHTHQPDIVVGTSIAGRNYQETEELLGFFINTLPLRTRFTSNLDLRSILQQTKHVALDAFEHQDVPFEMIVSELGLDRVIGVSPIFQVLFTFHNTKPVQMHFADITLNQLEIEQATAKYDIVLIVDEQGEQLRIIWNYKTSLFAASTIQRWAAQLKRILQEMVQEPDMQLQMLRAKIQDTGIEPSQQSRKKRKGKDLKTARLQAIQFQSVGDE